VAWVNNRTAADIVASLWHFSNSIGYDRQSVSGEAAMNILAFVNLLNIVIGGIIGVFSRNWTSVVLACALVGFGTNFAFDAFEYGKPFLHLRAGAIDFIGILLFGSLFHAAKNWKKSNPMVRDHHRNT